MNKITIVFLLFVWAGITAGVKARDLTVGDVPPDNIGHTLEGERVKISDHKGKVVIVSFWATWCPPCMEEIPILNAIQQQVSDDRLKVLSVNFQQDKRTVRKYAKHLEKYFDEVHLTFLYEKDNGISAKFGVDRLPYMFMIDHTGRIAHIHIGYSKETIPSLVEEINALLQEQQKDHLYDTNSIS
ncbi:TlpA family protein disulfide reductase [Kordiimonas pumila]|uniref:TlpA family protein disulfide reductase n=1 Tax=Kordiimonas pumila TaxID=2161677 RepID=A0ABV7D9L2_9PROT|nr:TlpA disulfide reductase family protein [Kordiimonas pumila]